MRIRQIKPSFWTDARIAALPAPARLFYIGLWMMADDAGWLRGDLPQIANELYGYDSRARRERNVQSFLAMLVAAERVTVHPCGHLEIPRLVTHQHLSVTSKQVKTVWREHTECGGLPTIPAETRGNPPMPVETRASPAVKVKGNGKVNVNGKGDGGGKVKGDGIARPLAPEGADARTKEDLPDFLRIVQ